ncbi:MAG TPA: ABC transporter permease [Thermoanaerobaculia bacterium]|nr:ABC transporter permease [Thermoanaerobaculia bacterium]
MTTPSDVISEQVGSAEAAAKATRPFAWSVRRELWENRSVYIAPLVVGSVALLGFTASMFGLPERRRAALLLEPAARNAKIAAPYDMAALVLIVTGLIVAIFYCLDALHGERRDRSLLFWKSLPVSDRTTVLSKAAIPFLIIPAIVFAVVMTVQLLMLLLSSAVLLANGMSPAATLAAWNPAVQAIVLLYGLLALVTWHAPIYAWFIFVSGWARRAVVLWAIVPLIAFSALFRVGWSSEEICSLLLYRAIGGMREAFIFTRGSAISSLSQLTPGKFFTTPGLWAGLALAVVLLAAAMRVRRNREPV